MPSTPPQVPRPTFPSNRNRQRIVETAPGPAAETSILRNSSEVAATLKKRRTALWAVGVAVIVIAGSILGARLKTHQQEQTRFTTVKEHDIPTDTTEPPSLTKSHKADQILSETEKEIMQTRPLRGNDKSGGTGLSHNQRQISFLEDRRGVLIKEKFTLQQKIERVKEKRRKEEAMESRRKIEITNDR